MRIFLNRWVIAALLFSGLLTLYTRNNEFSYLYHADEPGKTRQLMQDSRNFNHPLLLLTATDLVLKGSRAERTAQKIVVTGRWISAIFAAGAAAVFSLLAYRYAGALGAWASGLFVGLHPNLFEAAHYFKEDPALLFGTALSFLAFSQYWARRDSVCAAWVGAAAAVALSGKYIGVIMLGIGLLLVLCAGKDSRQRLLHSGALLLAAAVVVLLINHRLVGEFPVFQQGLSREAGFIAEGHEGFGRQVPHATYWRLFAERGYLPTAVRMLLALYLIHFFWRWREHTMPEWVLVLFPFAYTGMLSFSAKAAERYHLPAEAVICFLAGLGVYQLWRGIRTQSGRTRFPVAGAVAAVALSVGLITLGRQLYKRWDALAADHRMELARFLRDHVPADARIVEGRGVRLRDLKIAMAADLYPQRVKKLRYVSDIESFDHLTKAGHTHVILGKEHTRFLRPDVKVSAEQEAEFRRRRDFYKRLFEEGEVIWERRSGGSVLRPELRLYRLPPPAGNAWPVAVE